LLGVEVDLVLHEDPAAAAAVGGVVVDDDACCSCGPCPGSNVL